MNIAFHIAVKIDSTDRYFNLFKNIEVIRHYFPKVKIRVCESDTKRNLYTYNLTDNIDYFFLKQDKAFSKNECYNLLCLRSSEDIIVNVDVDYLTSKESYLEMYSILQNNPVCLGHNGTIININRDAFDKNSGETFTGSEIYTDYYSGIVGYRRDFLKFFKENNSMLGWGFDSEERKLRMSKLGIEVKRTNFPAYHMDHFRSDISSRRNPHYPRNGINYASIMNMSDEELTNYIVNQEVRQF